MTLSSADKDWRDALKLFMHPRVVTMLFLGFSAGIPILLIFSSLGLWLREAGVERSSVTFFSWAALGYSFKFVWAPLVDQLPLPYLTSKLGRRRGWLLLSQISIVIAIFWMGITDPSSNQTALVTLALAATLLGFSSATQDVVIDAYRIESAGKELQAMMSATYIAGYRIGMLVAGAGALVLASYLGSEMEHYNYQAWRWTYFAMATTMLIGIATTMLIKEPVIDRKDSANYSSIDYLRFLILFLVSISGFVATFYFSANVSSSAKELLTTWMKNPNLAGFVIELVRLTTAFLIAAIIARTGIRSGLVKQRMVYSAYIEPVRDYFNRYGFRLAFILLALIATYRISDIVLGVISTLFYQDLGYSKTEIAKVVKSFGLFMTIAGGFLGGLLSIRFGVVRILFLGAVLSAGTNLLFLWLSTLGHNIPMLYVVISADNLSAGLASAAFVAFLSSLTNISFTAVQFAIFTSLMSLLPKIIGGYSGSMVDSIGYPQFFLFTTLLGIPVLFLIVIAQKHLDTNPV